MLDYPVNRRMALTRIRPSTDHWRLAMIAGRESEQMLRKDSVATTEADLIEIFCQYTRRGQLSLCHRMHFRPALIGDCG